jgi:hypothetical protein
MDILNEEFKSSVAEIEKESDEGIGKVTAVMTDEGMIPAEAWADIVKNRYSYHINSIELMAVDKWEDQGTWYEQFMLKFESNKTVFVYIDIK